MTAVTEWRIPGHAGVLRPGVELTVLLPLKARGSRGRFMRADSDTGDITLVIAGRVRTVKPDAVRQVHSRSRKLRGSV